MTKELYIQNTTIRYLFYLLMSLSTTIEAKDTMPVGTLTALLNMPFHVWNRPFIKNPQDRHLYPLQFHAVSAHSV